MVEATTGSLESDAARVFSGEMSVGELEDLFIHFIEHNRFSAQDLAYLLESTGFDVVDAVPVKEGRFARLIATRK